MVDFFDIFKYFFYLTIRIIAGAVAERIKIEAYVFSCFVLIAFVYPFIAHWCWGSGFLM